MTQDPRHSSLQPEGDDARIDLTENVREFMRQSPTDDLSARIVQFIGNPRPGTQRAVFSHNPQSDLWFCDTFGDCWFCIRPEPPGGDPVEIS